MMTEYEEWQEDISGERAKRLARRYSRILLEGVAWGVVLTLGAYLYLKWGPL
jgi:hypothetical protein